MTRMARRPGIDHRKTARARGSPRFLFGREGGAFWRRSVAVAEAPIGGDERLDLTSAAVRVEGARPVLRYGPN